MASKFNVSDSEREVLEKIWLFPEGVKQPELLKLFEAEGKEWKRQTLNTFIARMEEKGVVTREDRVVKALYTKEEFYNNFMEENITAFYGGKLSKLVSALLKNKKIAEEDVKELKKFINTYEEGEL